MKARKYRLRACPFQECNDRLVVAEPVDFQNVGRAEDNDRLVVASFVEFQGLGLEGYRLIVAAFVDFKGSPRVTTEKSVHKLTIWSEDAGMRVSQRVVNHSIADSTEA